MKHIVLAIGGVIYIIFQVLVALLCLNLWSLFGSRNIIKVSQIQTMDRHGSFHNCTFFVGTFFFQFDWALPFDGKEDKLWFWVGAVSKLDKGQLN